MNKKPAGAVSFSAFGVAAITTLLAATPAFAEKKPIDKTQGRPLKIIILAGQSNMQEPASWLMLKGLADSPETKPLYDKLVDANGKVRVFPEVRQAIFSDKSVDESGNEISPSNFGSPLPYKFGGLVLPSDKTEAAEDKVKNGKKGGKRGGETPGGNFGPELGFGVTLYEDLQEPILLVKTAWGGKSLYKDFRPPTGTEWVPPAGNPDHPDSAPKPLPIPETFELPADFKPPTGHTKNMQIFSGIPLGEMKGLYPVYVVESHGEKGELQAIPLETGDLVLGINGEGLPEDPVKKWRDAWFNDAREGDWKVKITRWRAGKIETITVDTSKTLKQGSDSADEVTAEKKAAQKKLAEEGGEYYAMMMARIKEVLADPGKYHPAYDPKQGFELAGFVWFQGYNDYIAATVYPNGNKPRGFEQYSWLLSHLIRNVRTEFKVPKLPVVIGVFGQGGGSDTAVHFREAQAAVADYGEFKGNVVAVQTVGFFDNRIPEIQDKLDRVMEYKGGDQNHPYAKLQAKIQAYKEQMGDPEKLEGKQKSRLIVQIKKGVSEIVKTDEEKEYLKNNASNQGYHYFGAPKFFVRAGEAFAKALSGVMKK